MSLPRTVWSLSLLISLTNAANADIAPGRNPRPKPPIVAPVKIVEGNVDSRNANAVAKIVIPSSLLPDLQESQDPWSASRVPNEFPVTGTTIAGLALTAVAISLMFVSKTNRHWKKGVVCLIGGVLLVGFVLLANFLFPPKFNATSETQLKPQPQIVIEVQRDGHEVILVLPSRK